MSTVPQPGGVQASSSTLDGDPSSTISWEGDRMFNIYIYDYCHKRGYKKTARELLIEANIPAESHPPIDARQGLLFEWWSVFWVLFTAKANGSGSEDAMIYTQHQAQQHANRMARLPSAAGTAMTSQPPPPAPLNRPAINGVGVHPGPRSFLPGNGPPMPNGVGPNPGAIPAPMNGMPGPGQPPNPQHPNFQQGPLANQQRNSIGGGAPGVGPRPPNGLPFHSPTMHPHSPQNPGAQGQQPHQSQPSGPQLNQQHPQNSMGQLPTRSPRMGPQGGMLPPNAPGQPVPGPNHTPTNAYQQLARPPSRSGSPGQGNLLTQPSPLMANRQPPGMTQDMISMEISRIPPPVLEQIKREVAVEIGKDVNSMTPDEKMRIVVAHRRVRKPPTATNIAAGSQNVMLPPNQRGIPVTGPVGRPAKRNTSGEEPENAPGAGSSPPDSKRPRRSPMDTSMGYPHLPQTGMQPSGPGGLQPQQSQVMPNGLMKPGMPGATQSLFGPQGMQGPMGMGMGMPNNNGMTQSSLGGMPPPMGNTMSPAMGGPMSGPPNMMNNPQYKQTLTNYHRSNISGIVPGSGSDPSFGMGNIPGAPRPGGGPQFDPNAANRPKPGMGMIPTSPGLNKDIKDGKPDGSPHTTAGRTPTATGTAASTPVTNPAQPPPPLHQQSGQQNQGPTNPGQMEPSSNSMLGNPGMSMVGGPGGPSADLFPADFLSNVASGLDDFDNGLFTRADGDINFERDFGQWFNPEDVSGLDTMK